MTTLTPVRIDIAEKVVSPAPAPAASSRRPSEPQWTGVALVVLLAGTAALYLWGLGRSGWANSFYSAAVQAGSKSWKAMFFGSSDAANFITVDKPPVALWVMDLSARLFGVNSWAILVPEALEGVAAVAVLYAAVRRWFGRVAGLMAGAVMALTPVAALMFRFNNPDALLVLLLTGAAYAMVRALEAGRTRWLILAGTLIGFGFLTKMLQALLVVPAFALVYLIAAPTPLRRRLGQLLAAGGALVVASLWWVAVVELIPAGSRPYIGGSQDNSIWNLIFGYNGFGRLTGNEAGSVGGGGSVGSRWGITGLTRLFNADFGGQASWLLPAALILLVAGLALTWRASRTDRTRMALLLWGGWLVATAAVFSFGEGIIHPYYTVALAPAIGALVGVGGTALWARRGEWGARVGLAAATAASALWAYVLLERIPSWNPWLAPLVVITGLAAAGLLLAWSHVPGPMSAVVAAVALVAALAGPGAYTLATVSTAHSGAIPSAGPAGAGATGAPPGGRGFRGGGGGIGGLLNASTPSAALTSLLEQGSRQYTWVAATVGSNTASGYQLATSSPVMAIGGFNGTDPAPSLAQFERQVAQGQIHYFIAGGSGGGGGASGSAGSDATEISGWVATHFSSQSVSGVTVYDLSHPAA